MLTKHWNKYNELCALEIKNPREELILLRDLHILERQCAGLRNNTIVGIFLATLGICVRANSLLLVAFRFLVSCG